MKVLLRTNLHKELKCIEWDWEFEEMKEEEEGEFCRLQKDYFIQN